MSASERLVEGYFGGYANFYLHELQESTPVSRGMSQPAAHAAALAKYRLSPLLGSTFTHSGPGFTSRLAFTQSYTYDGVNRLASVTDTGYTRSFGYDPFANMYVKAGPTGVIPPANTPQSASMYSNNQLPTSGGIYSYDAAGNETFVNGNTVTYDAENRQTGVSGTGVNETYVYDGDGRRVGKVSGAAGSPTTVFVYDAMGRMAAEYSSVTDTPSCVTCYMSPDQLGTPRLITDQNGSVVARHDYLPFGEEVGANAGRGSQWAIGNDSINQKFTGKERDSESGLDYFGARYYGSALGRFTSPDWSSIQQPIPYANLRDPQTLNLYSYVRNSPLSAADLDGHGFWKKFWNSLFTDAMCFCEGDEAEALAQLNRGRMARAAAHGYRPTTEVENKDQQDLVTSTIVFAISDAAADSGSLSDNAAADADDAVEETALTLINGRRPINYQYAGGTHPAGVPFSTAGFPDFSSQAVAAVQIDGLTGNVAKDSALANQAAGLSDTPKGYTWHHVEDGKTMQLVPRDIHEEVRHTGGAAVIRSGASDK